LEGFLSQQDAFGKVAHIVFFTVLSFN